MKLSTKELLEIAENEETTPEILSEIWNTSRSVKIRKAVAKNPNASADVLRQAARLYMEEVVNNPGFEMLRLFDDDRWIKRIGEIYDDPKSFFGKSRYIAYRTSELEVFGRAALLSPNCDAISISNLMCYVPVASIKRVFKNEEVKQRIKEKVVSAYGSGVNLFDLEGLFKSWEVNLLTTKELANYIRSSGMISSMSCRKSVYVKTFRALSQEYKDTNDEDAAEALALIFLVSRESCYRWINWEVDRTHIDVIVNAFKRVKKLAKVPNKRTGSYTKSAIKNLAGLIVDLCWTRSYNQKDAILEFYNIANQLEFPPHEWGNSKYTWPVIKFNLDFCEELDKMPIQVKAFYARACSLGHWFHLTRSDIKTKIIEEVNEWLYERGGVGNLLYNQMHIKKIIALDDDIVIPI